MPTPWRTLRILVCVALVTAGAYACGPEPVEPAENVDHLVATFATARPFYPVHDTVRVALVAVRPDGTSFRLGQANWRSFDSTVASVEEHGLISMLAPGSVSLEAEAFGKRVSVQVAVRGLLHFAAIHSRETWVVADSPHVVQGFLQVSGPDTAVVAIEPAQRVLFRPGSGLEFGDIEPGRLVTAGGGTVDMQGDPDLPGTWAGLRFVGTNRSELRDLHLSGCGGPGIFTEGFGCIAAAPRGGADGPTLLLDDVTITGARVLGMSLENFVRLDPASRRLSIVDGDGHIATIPPALVPYWPLGGRLEGNADNTIWVGDGIVSDSATWPDPGAPWRLVGGVSVSGPAAPVLTLPAGLHLQADVRGAIIVGFNGHGGLRMGGPAGPTTVIESAGNGWRGIEFAEGAMPSELDHVELRDCGLSLAACVQLHGTSTIRVADVAVLDSRSIGIRFSANSRFAAGSTNLTVAGAADVPIEMRADDVPLLPPGDYGQNPTPGIRLVQSVVVRTATWRDPGVPYIAPTDLHIGDDVNDPVLTLDPGVVLLMGASTRVVVGEGALRAIGTQAQPIRFASEVSGTAGSWMGVELGTAADARTRLDHIEIQDAGAGDPGGAGALRLQLDPGGVLRNSRIVRSASCGVMLFSGAYADDYLDPAAGNSFVEVAGPSVCTLAP